MTDEQVARELIATAKLLMGKDSRAMASKSHPGWGDGYVESELIKADLAIGAAAGGMHYRLYDREGSKTFPEGEPFLTENERREVAKAHKAAEEARTLCSVALRKISKIDLDYR